MRRPEGLGFISVDPGCHLVPSALHIDALEADAASNESVPLVCGAFDCELLHSRARFAMVDTRDGFYMLRGICSTAGNATCYLLTSVFTPNTTAGIDDFTIAMIWSIVALALVVVLLAIVFSCYLRRKRGIQAEMEGSKPLRTYAV
jgi:hypothetical protein